MSSLRSRSRTALLALAAAAALSAPTALAPAAALVPDEGVTVVVDFTDLGGQVDVGFAPGDPDTGREALEAAGFTSTDSTPGMICAIDAMPDPCPEEFDGSFWSYWTAVDDEWVAHTEGADGIDPAPGDVEGWRYSDGSAGPQLTPQEAQAQVAGAGGDDGEGTEGGTDDDGASDDGDQAPDSQTQDGQEDQDAAAQDDAGSTDAEDGDAQDGGAQDADAEDAGTQDAGGSTALWLVGAAVVVILIIIAGRFLLASHRADKANTGSADADGSTTGGTGTGASGASGGTGTDGSGQDT